MGHCRDLMQHPRKVSEVRLRGLQVKISPAMMMRTTARTQEREVRGPEPGGYPQSAAGHHRKVRGARHRHHPHSKARGKQPKVFTVHHLVMDSLGVNQTIPYIATLTNPVPKGEIETSGAFGPSERGHILHARPSPGNVPSRMRISTPSGGSPDAELEPESSEVRSTASRCKERRTRRSFKCDTGRPAHAVVNSFHLLT